jgi:hypothetical protein
MTRPDDVAHTLREQAPSARGPSTRPTARSLSPRQRKLALATHIVVSVGLLGIYAAALILGTVAAATPDPETSSAAYRSMGILRGVIPPAAGGVVVTGVILALGTTWGLFKHYWVVVKLALAVAALPVSILVVFPAVRHAIAATSPAAPLTAPDLGSAPLLLIAASGAIVLMLGAATVLAVYKPWGAIRRARRATARPAA